MDKDKVLKFLENEIAYQSNRLLMCCHDGMVHNQCSAIIKELKMIKRKIEDDSYLNQE